MGSRVLLGLGEGAAYPVALHAAYKWFANERRAVPTGLIAIGAAVGTGVAAPAVSYVIIRWSWHTAFGMLGTVGLAWCVVWLIVGRDGPLGTTVTSAAARNRGNVPYRTLLASRTVIGIQMIGFCAYWLLTLAVVWLPAYLGEGLGYGQAAIGWIVTLPALCQIVLVPAVCMVSQRLKRRGVSSRAARGGVTSACVVTAGLLTMLFPVMPTMVLPIACMAIALSVGNVIFVLGPVMVAEVTPVGQRGAMLGMTNALITLAGPLAPIAMGALVDLGADPVAGFRTGFIVAGAVMACGGLAGFLLMNPEADRRRPGAKAA